MDFSIAVATLPALNVDGLHERSEAQAMQVAATRRMRSSTTLLRVFGALARPPRWWSRRRQANAGTRAREESVRYIREGHCPRRRQSSRKRYS